ncbi:TPA: hypothetical protein DDW35_06495 [Candidatus Sumerlaeota bacterium]|nr:hypothetical protein [Candidatus Sumerlaeota bacterium]
MRKIHRIITKSLLLMGIGGLLTACSISVQPNPFEPSASAKTQNYWPLYRNVSDAEKEFTQTDILWPLCRYRKIPAGSMLRIWPLYYGFSGPDTHGVYLFPLAVFAFPSATTVPAKQQTIYSAPNWLW